MLAVIIDSDKAETGGWQREDFKAFQSLTHSCRR
jgi:hypothetical protein